MLLILHDIGMMLVVIVSFLFIHKINNNEKIKTPAEKIKTVVEKIQENKQRKKEEENRAIMLENIDNYDGTSRGQKDLRK